MERKRNMDAHISIPEIIRLAMQGEYHSHFLDCAFCREQYEDALELEEYLAGDCSIESTDQSPDIPAQSYRLAAQSTDGDEVARTTHVRRTWYLESGSVILRVMEDTERHILYGHLIIEPERLTSAVVRFSGIDTDYLPDAKGLFEIGVPTLEIERMEVTVSRTGEK